MSVLGSCSIPVIVINLFIGIVPHCRWRWDHPTDLVHRTAPVFHHLIKYKRGKCEFDFQLLLHLSWMMALPQKCLSSSSSAWTSSLPSSLHLAHSYATLLDWVKSECYRWRDENNIKDQVSHEVTPTSSWLPYSTYVSVLGFSFVFHDKVKRTQQGILLPHLLPRLT